MSVAYRGAVRGIISYAGYVPYRRLDRQAITEFMGSGGGRGTRSVASFDEDTTSMGVEAARFALRSLDGAAVQQVLFATAEPAYLEKTNATAIHAALRLDASVPALDVGGAVRSGVGVLRLALGSSTTTLAVTAGIRVGLPTSADESTGGDGAAAFLVGDDSPTAPVIAELIGAASATAEFVDRWRTPGDLSNRQWEERLGETIYGPLGTDAWTRALGSAGLAPADVTTAAVVGFHERATKRLAGSLGAAAVADDLSAVIGNSGAAQAGLALANSFDTAEPGQVLALVVVADGVEVLLFRTTPAIVTYRRFRPVATQIANAGAITYAKYLAWRGILTPQPPNRPTPDRTSSSAAARSRDWKYGFVGSRDHETGAVHLPPARVSFSSGSVDDMEPVPMADLEGTVVTSTVDRLAYSPSPPIVFAVVDFDGGGRAPLELTDVDAGTVEIGDRVEMTFRRLSTGDGIHNYFWKARPVRGEPGSSARPVRGA